jgi:DNA-binding NarL/FixJ family response regulator
MYTRVPVALYTADPISQVGLSAALRSRPEVLLVDQDDEASAKICIVALEHWGEDSFRTLKTIQSRGCDSSILVINDLTDADLLSAVEAGVCALVWRSDATPSELARVITHVASGNGALPPDVLGRLLKKVSRLQHDVLAPMGIDLTGLSSREADVLKLMSHGQNTGEIAKHLCYSDRTVTNILHDVTTRFHLRNRTHAVAFALREGLI